MASVNVIYRPSSRTGRYQGSLCLRLIHDRRVKTISLKGCRIYPDEWDQKAQEIICTTSDACRQVYLKNIRRLIDHEKSLTEHNLDRLAKQGRYSVDELAFLCREAKDESKLLGYGQHLCFELEARGQIRTARAYRTVTQAIVSFNKGKDIPLEQVNNRLLKDFEMHLKDRGRLPNTISYYMRNLRAIYNKAIAEKRIGAYNLSSPFSGVYTGVTQTMKRSLSLQEIQKIHTLDFFSLLKKEKYNTTGYKHLEKLYAAHRYFSFCFHTRGMCFIDMAYLRKDNIRGGVIRYVRKKTGRQIEVKLTDEMQMIIDSFASQVTDSAYVFPILCHNLNNKNTRARYEAALRSQNCRLKKIARLAGVYKPVSTHWARHTWATIGKQQAVPLRVISECLGHSSEKTTLIYLDMLDNSVLDAASRLVTSAITRPRGCMGKTADFT